MIIKSFKYPIATLFNLRDGLLEAPDKRSTAEEIRRSLRIQRRPPEICPLQDPTGGIRKLPNARETTPVDEFGKKLNQAQLHKELQHRKMRPNETVFQYLVAIRELANRGQGFLDETSIMEYCINGIPDSPSNKLILYGLDKQIDEWIQNGVIEPCSSAYASQVLVVRKKDGSPRVCIDFRKLNRVLVKDHYPLPLIEDILDKLQDTRVFSTIDLRNGFFHVPVNKQSRPYTSFVTQNGQFQFLKMPFGLSTCPSTFQRFINTVFRDLVVQGIVLPYMDDIVILAKNESEAIERLKKVLQVSSDYGLK
ncbi:hypothetical protein TNCV_4936591 [Trichonephila clavipes]|nr:hypothetical protein TNCV_4936591 [Trichonephila clavipes]